MNKKFSSSVITVALSVLLTACSGDWCKKSAASSSATTGAAGAAVTADNVVLFEFDSSKVSDEGKETTKTWAAKIKEMKDAKVIITGHCSEEGSEAYNNGLGERRANAVAESLESDGSGVKADVVSYGKSADFGEGLVKNRRAIIHTGEVSDVPNGQAVSKKTKVASKKKRMQKAKKAKKAE